VQGDVFSNEAEYPARGAGFALKNVPVPFFPNVPDCKHDDSRHISSQSSFDSCQV